MAVPLALAALGAPAFAATERADFNNDGRGDILIGVPGEDTKHASDAGAVNIVYGAFDPPYLNGNLGQFIHQNSDNVNDKEENGDHFGASVAVGDFNGDGYDDAAIGVPDEDVGSVGNGGGVEVIYGSPTGLTPKAVVHDQFLTQDKDGVRGKAQTGDHFGAAVAAADFNGDGKTDLAVGVPGEDAGATDAGAVNVLYGSTTGISTSNDIILTQNTGSGDAEPGDGFGARLAAGDLDGNGKYDLVVGIPQETVSGAAGAGAIETFYGAADNSGLTGAGSNFVSEDTPNISSTAEAGEHFGAALTTGDVNGDSRADVVIGVPGQSVSGAGAGAIHVIYGSVSGLTTAGEQEITQDSDNVGDQAEAGDGFGSALASADVNGDGKNEVVVGIPGEDVNGMADAGATETLYGSPAGTTTSGDQFISQDSPGIVDKAETGDLMGAAVSAVDLNGDGKADLVAGAPGEYVKAARAGAMSIVFSSPTGSGLSSNNDLFISQNTDSVNSSAEPDDMFGAPLAGTSGSS